MSLNSNALIKIEELRPFLGQNEDNANLPTERQEMFINSVSQWIENYCERKFISGTDTWITNGNERMNMFVRYRPIVSVTSISYWNGTTWTVMESATYLRTNSDEEIWFTDGNVFPWGRKNIKIVYTYGYAIGSVPFDLKQAAADHVSWQIKALEKSGIKSESWGDQTVTLEFGTPPDRIMAIYNRYKRMVISD